MTHPLDDTRPTVRVSIIDRTLEHLPTADRDALIRALRDKDRVSDRTIADWLASIDRPVAQQTLWVYRHGTKLAAFCERHNIDLANL